MSSPSGASVARRSTVKLVLGSVAGQVAVAVLLAVLARSVTVSEFGASVSLLGLAVLLVDLLDFGTSPWALREASRTENAALLSRVLGQKMVPVGGICVLLVVGACLGAIQALPILLFLLLAALRSMIMTLQVRFQLREMFGVAAFGLIIDRWLAVLVLLGLLALGCPAQLLLPIALLAGSLLGAAYLFKPRHYVLESALVGLKRPLGLFRHAPSFAVASCVTDVIGLDVLVVQLIVGPHAAGVFALPSRLVGPASTLTLSVAAAAYPAMSRAATFQEAKRLLSKVAYVPVLLVFLGLTASGLAAPLIIRLYAGSRYIDAVTPMRFYLFGAAFASLVQLAQALLQARGLERYVASVQASSAAIFLVGVSVGAAVGGVDGASLAFSITSFAVVAAMLWKISCQSSIQPRWR